MTTLLITTEIPAITENVLKFVFVAAFLIQGWRLGVVVTRWSRSTRLTYAEPG